MKVLIIEDEAAAVRRLKKMILEIDPDVEILTDLDSIETSVDWLSNNTHPDLLFMDINLADGNSFEIFEHVKIEKPIIFTTAYDEFALKAFKVNALDYLLKPVKKIELENAISKYKYSQQTQTPDYHEIAKALQQKSKPKRFLIRIGQQIKVVELSEVSYFYTQDKITFLITKEGKRYPIDHTLDQVESIVDESNFYRVNRQFVISMSSISEMQSWSKSRVRILLQPPVIEETIVSTTRSPHFKKWLTGDI